ncbi:MAG TPA: hypothetical protein VNO35_17095 [Steroidobacteraceae bacterium]|nr:hypothetical protein [Steroidobacteraceae bacterium]
MNVTLRQNGTDSDASGMLINVQNQGKGFLSATEFATSIVDPVSNKLTAELRHALAIAVPGAWLGSLFVDRGRIQV